MLTHLSRDLDKLKKKVLTMGGMVEEATNLAINSLVTRRPEHAEEVIKGDDNIDRMELELEDDCLKILALHQPVASDLRFVVAIMKVNNDLERVGDLALNLAERAIELADRPPVDGVQELKIMANKVSTMLRMSLDSLVNRDSEQARHVCELDEEVDNLHRQRFDKIEQLIQSAPEHVNSAVVLLSVSRYLERIADHATNVAEDVVFMVDGVVIRHGGTEPRRISTR